MTSFINQQTFSQHSEVVPFVTAATVLGFCYFSTVVGIRMGRRFSLAPISNGSHSASQNQQPKILDTSAIIDGRIADLSKTGFLDGPLLVPQFVLRELQRISDSLTDISTFEENAVWTFSMPS